MPPGSRRKKEAAKKKKGKEAPNSINNGSSTNSSQGNDDPRSQDERESDGGEVSSPVSQDHHNQQPPFGAVNEESGKGDALTAQSSIPDSESMESANAEGNKKSELEDVAVVKIERDFAKGNVESETSNAEHVESTKESHDGDERSSSSSSSDDESESHKKKWKEEAKDVVNKAKEEAKDVANKAKEEAKDVVNKTEKAVHSFFEHMTHFSEKEKPPIEANGKKDPGNASIDLSTPVVPISEVAEHVAESSQVETTEVLEVVGSGLQNTEEKYLSTSNEVTGVKDDNVAPISNENEGKILPSADSTTKESDIVSGAFDGATDGNEGKLLTSSDTKNAQSNNNAENSKGCGTHGHEHDENEPLVAPAPRVAQRTSVMSCCGILDLFTGSGR